MSSYKLGNYYLDWMNTLNREHDVTFEKMVDSTHNLNQYDCLIFGHSFINYNRNEGYHVMDMQDESIMEKVLRKLGYIKQYHHLRSAKIPKIFLSKNDYREPHIKALLAKYLKVNFLVSHSKEAAETYRQMGVSARWIPFGVDIDKFKERYDKTIDIGFMGNNMTHLRDELLGDFDRNYRVDFANAVTQRFGQTKKCDIRLLESFDDYIQGQEYLDWMAQCRLVLNVPSLMHTIGTRFFETMATGGIPLSLTDEFEGLLIPHKHYIPVAHDYHDLEQNVNKFYDDPSYADQLKKHCNEFVHDYSIQKTSQKMLEEATQ